MKTGTVVRWICAVAAMIAAALTPAVTHADVNKLNISQISQSGNDLYLYVDVLQSDGRASEDELDPKRFMVFCDAGDVEPTLEAVRVGELGEGVAYTFCMDISRSVTDEEMSAIREAVTAFVGGISDRDFVRIVTIGADVTPVCEWTQDKEEISAAVSSITNSDGYTYLYRGLDYALDGYRKDFDSLPRQSAIILFSDGMDDSDGSSSEKDILDELKDVKVPVYVVGLKGKDTKASLTSVSQIARQSGGCVFSYNNMSIPEAVTAVGDVVNGAYRLLVRPEEEVFAHDEPRWRVRYSGDDYKISSAAYKCPLSREGVSFEQAEAEAVQKSNASPTSTASSEAGSGVSSTTEEPALAVAEADAGKKAEAFLGMITGESESGQESSDSAASESTRSDSGVEEVKEPGDAISNVLQSISDGEKPAGGGFLEKLNDLIRKNLALIIAGALIIVALILLLAALIGSRRRKKALAGQIVEPPVRYDSDDPSVLDDVWDGPVYVPPTQKADPFGGAGAAGQNPPSYIKTDSFGEDDEKTVGGVYFSPVFGKPDNDETIDVLTAAGVLLRFTIQFDGQTKTVEKRISDDFVLGRGPECDLDVTLGMDSDSRRYTSHKHAVLSFRQEGGLTVRDEGSRNKVILNGNEISGEAPVRHGDVLTLGKAEVRIDVLKI